MEKVSALKAWFLAARPKTLTATLTPVITASALAYHDGCFQWFPATVCLVFAVLSQIVANFANDYFDFKKGSDRDDRLGPKRAVAEAWIKPETMLRAVLLLLAVDLAIGLLLLPYGGMKLIVVGAVVAVFALLYSGGPYPLAYHAWGDVCVFIFFGIVPVGFTYYVQAQQWPLPVWICAAAVGFVIINILVANNYRDRDTDARAGKKTSIVLFGERFGQLFYLFNGIIAVAVCQYFTFTGNLRAGLLPLLYLVFHVAAWREMRAIGSGRGLIVSLEKSARNVLVFGGLLALGLI
ncbi:MAG: 1,4-dihydroxy-2-naphthoate polyprenyltransferase [Dysgonamonadaceae bacterium]|jgi:1,4-dihydroxy-2-naphthoate octaprenyltransferase|nr:1,4-dihydroxy-2-naphthoate polyprenyltransferase [Dysgonamonadaceae bacterium]